MAKKWLLRLSYDNPQWSDTDPARYKFEQDKDRIDEFFLSHAYNILSIDIKKEKSYKLPRKELYVLGKDFFDYHNIFKNPPKNSTEKNDLKSFMLEMSDTIIMALKCLKDLVQEIGGYTYINPHAQRLKFLFELIGFNVISKDIISEGGIFLKGVPAEGTPFLIVSHDLIEHFRELQILLLRSPPNIGTDQLDTHIDTYLGIINFKARLAINGTKFNGILYIHQHSLKKIQKDPLKQDVWSTLKNEMEHRGYFIREYIPKTPAQNIGINFKFDKDNYTILTNAFPSKERKFLQGHGIKVIAPEHSFSTNDSYSGGINCSYLLIPDNENIQTHIISWIKNRK